MSSVHYVILPYSAPNCAAISGCVTVCVCVVSDVYFGGMNANGWGLAVKIESSFFCADGSECFTLSSSCVMTFSDEPFYWPARLDESIGNNDKLLLYSSLFADGCVIAG